MTDQPPLIWHSNAPWSPTGYGQQSALFTPRLAQHYDKLLVSSFYGLEGAPLDWNGLRVLPGLGGTYGNESVPAHAQRYFGGPKDGLIVTLMDVWVLNPQMIAAHNVASWVPVDHDPAPPRVVDYFQHSGAVPIAMSRFGQERLAAFDPLYCPHGVDTEALKPIDKAEAKKQMGVPEDCFLVGMVAANKGNPSRKSFVAALEAFSRFYGKHEDARLYLHTDFEGHVSGGVHLGPVVQALGIPPAAVGYQDPYTAHFAPASAKAMAIFYSAMDVLLNPATGEGFGVPILEAQACGVPVIVTDFSAMPEVGAVGWHVDGAKWWTAQDSWQMQPYVSEIVDALEECHSASGELRAKLSERAREHALQYDVDRVVEEFMLPALGEAWDRLTSKPVELVA